MRTSSILSSVGLLATGSLAAPGGWGNDNGGSHCLTEASAYHVAQNFQSLIAAYTNETAEAVTTTDLVDYSASVDELINGGCPSPENLDDPTFTSQVDFEAGQGGQPNITFNILGVWHGCDHVTVRWRSPEPNPLSGAPAVQEDVTGVILLETRYDGSDAAEPYKIKTVYSEFNSGAWLYDLGIFKPDCSGSTSKRSVLPPFFTARK